MTDRPAAADERRWGRFGPEDERGALNLVSPEVTRAAAALVRSGRVYPLGLPIGRSTPMPPERSPVLRFMTRDQGDYAAGARRPGGFQFAEDTVMLPAHTGTHIDALGHVWYDDTLYNGFPASSIRSTTGARRCGVDKLGPIVTRGVLLDLAGGGPTLAPGREITVEDLEACAARHRVNVRSGDAVLVRTGWLSTWAHDPERFYAGEPGLGLDAARWLADHGAGLVGADNYAVEVTPFAGDRVFPVHMLLLRDRGVPLIEYAVLDGLAADRCHEFLFVAAPLPVEGGTGSPLVPIAVA